MKYGKAAHLTVQSRNEMLELVVDDEGPGIPPDQREALLEPFVRLETSCNRRVLTGGRVMSSQPRAVPRNTFVTIG